MSISGIQSNGIQTSWYQNQQLQNQQVQNQQSQQQQAAQAGKPADGDGDHGVEPGKGQNINLLG